MKQTIIILLVVVLSSRLYGQSTIDNILRDIESNNTTLQAFEQQTEAQKLDNRTDIYLPNPEVGFGYLWGSPASTGKRTDFSVTQSFDFPTAYAHKSRIADNRNNIADYEYERLRKDILLQAGVVCINLVYCNELKTELNKRLQHAQNIASAWQERFTLGDADIIERNKARLNLLNARKALEANEIERIALLSELQRLNGGLSITFNDEMYPEYVIPENFEQWYESIRGNNPELQIANREIEVSRQQIKLSRAMNLPKLSTGYMSENILGTTLQGVTVGVSIPLWENKNSIRQAKAQAIARQEFEADIQVQLYNRLKAQHTKATSLQALAEDYRKALQTSDNADLLKKALDSGQLSLINYIMELTVYYDAVENMLQAERDGQLAVMELRSVMI